jgi:hypothetical protein
MTRLYPPAPAPHPALHPFLIVAGYALALQRRRRHER